MKPETNAAALRGAAKGREFWVWGAKVTGRSAGAYIVRSGIGALGGFIDLDPARRAKPLMGLEVLGPEEFFRLHSAENAFVVIAARQYEEQIAEELSRHGFAEADRVSAYDILGPIYELDVTRLCNLKCPSCAQGNYPGKPCTEKMTAERYKRMLAHILKITPNVAHIGLYSWGEPFLHPGLPEFISLTRAAGVPCFLSSNLSHEFPLEPVLRAEPDYFRASISGYSQDVYKVDHVGGDINLVKSNLYRLRHYIDKLGLCTSVEVVYHKYRYNLAEVAAVEALCRELGFSFAAYVASILPTENLIRIYSGQDVTDLRPLMERILFDFEKLPRENLIGREEECFAFHHSIGLTPDARVMVCHNTFDLEKSCVGQDFFAMDYEDIIAAKRENVTCTACRRLGVPRMWNAVIDDEGNFTGFHKDG